MRAYLIRHPKTVAPEQHCYGSSDIAACAIHQQQCLPDLIATLPTALPMFCSPLKRCSAFATVLSTALRCPTLTIDDRLKEMDFGHWELKPWDAINRSEIDAWATAPLTYAPGDGETALEMATRVSSFYQVLLNSTIDSIIVCHAGTIRMLMACTMHDHVEQIAQQAFEHRSAIEFGKAVSIDFPG
jgi:alpha-ribazole phosphatase